MQFVFLSFHFIVFVSFNFIADDCIITEFEFFTACREATVIINSYSASVLQSPVQPSPPRHNDGIIVHPSGSSRGLLENLVLCDQVS